MILHDLILLNILVNVTLCLIIITWDTYFYFKVNETEKWAKILYIFVATLWLVRYVLFFLDYKTFGEENVEPHLLMLVTLTLLSLAIGSVIRVQRICGFQGLKNDILNLLKKVKLWISRTH